MPIRRIVSELLVIRCNPRQAPTSPHRLQGRLASFHTMTTEKPEQCFVVPAGIPRVAEMEPPCKRISSRPQPLKADKTRNCSQYRKSKKESLF